MTRPDEEGTAVFNLTAIVTDDDSEAAASDLFTITVSQDPLENRTDVGLAAPVVFIGQAPSASNPTPNKGDEDTDIVLDVFTDPPPTGVTYTIVFEGT